YARRRRSERRRTERKMKLKIAKVVLRVIGTLSALLGLSMLCAMILVFLLAKTKSWDTLLILPILIVLPFALWQLYVGYLVWRDFSPRVVRQVCGVLVFLGYIFIARNTVLNHETAMNLPWSPLASIGLILVACAVHRVVSKQFNHWLFLEFG
ncbi:MAG: hypothetical protein NTY01_11880, partial [Verrucomicrobia bacterium]|nr:hypothetical protein [Verrucomicrobiota bacterium]